MNSCTLSSNQRSCSVIDFACIVVTTWILSSHSSAAFFEFSLSCPFLENIRSCSATPPSASTSMHLMEFLFFFPASTLCDSHIRKRDHASFRLITDSQPRSFVRYLSLFHISLRCDFWCSTSHPHKTVRQKTPSMLHCQLGGLLD